MEEKKKYIVTNKAKDVRKFRDRFLGKDIFVGPKKFILTDHPPEESEIWKVEKFEKLEKKTIKSREDNKKMVKKIVQNDSSSSR